MGAHVALDIGGTFTDLVYFNDSTDELRNAKSKRSRCASSTPMSVDGAKQEYGVVAKANGKGGLDAVQLDAEATRRTRQEMRGSHAG